MPTLAILTVVRNEADRWLPSMLEAWGSFADTIIAVDDGSTDDTAWLLREHPKVDYYLREAAEPMWGQEASVRQELWKLGANSGADWLMVLDADMVPTRNPRILLVEQADSVAFNLYDLWSTDPLAYRRDGFWQGHANWRIWCVRNPGPTFEDEWPERGIHCGHLPSNLPPGRVLQAPASHGLLHYAYSNPTERLHKHAQYMNKASLLSEQELAHANSILDEAVSLAPTPSAVYPITYEG